MKWGNDPMECMDRLLHGDNDIEGKVINRSIWCGKKVSRKGNSLCKVSLCYELCELNRIWVIVFVSMYV